MPNVAYVTQQILKWLPLAKSGKPLFVCINGAQGAGKTTLVRGLLESLSKSPNSLNVASFSLDDVYLTRSQQAKLAMDNPDNELLKFRGNPGTHDLKLCTDILNALENNQRVVKIPFYDKSLANGLGDRSDESQWTETRGPWNVVLFEGWCNGFRPVPDVEVAYRESHRFAQKFSLDNVKTILIRLDDYQALWERFDVCVHLNAKDLSYSYKWRWQQEEAMMSEGKPGLTHDQVQDFVDRFMPLNEICLPAFITQGMFPGKINRHLRLDVDENRQIVETVLI